MNFTDLGLSERTIYAIDECGIKEPTTVQVDVIPSILQGKDVFTIAPQGCGKTCSYIFPLIDVISNKAGQNILIITASSEDSVEVSDRLAVFNKYHEINESEVKDTEEDIDMEANVIIGTPDLLLELVESERVDIANTNILVVDDINLIKKNKQLDNLNKVLEMLPQNKQNIVYTNRRSKETNEVLDKILKAPQEVKIDKAKEQEAQLNAPQPVVEEAVVENKEPEAKPAQQKNHKDRKNRHERKSGKPQVIKNKSSNFDKYAVELSDKFNTFNNKTPEFMLLEGVVVENE